MSHSTALKTHHCLPPTLAASTRSCVAGSLVEGQNYCYWRVLSGRHQPETWEDFGLFRFEGVDLFAEFVANFLNDYGFTVKEPPQHPPPPSPEGVDHHQTKTLEDFAPFVLEKLIS